MHMHASGFIHHGKSQHWNRGGCEPAGVAELTSVTRLVELDAVWKSDPELPLPQNGFLAAPIGHSLLGRRVVIFRESLQWRTSSSVAVVVVVVVLWSNSRQFFHVIGSQTGTMTERANTVATGQDHSSWADTLPIVRQRHPDVADTIITDLELDPVLCFRAVRDCEGHFREAGFEPRPWEDIATKE